MAGVKVILNFTRSNGTTDSKEEFHTNMYAAQKGALNMVADLCKKDPGIQLGDTEFIPVQDAVEVKDAPQVTQTSYIDIDDGQVVS